MLGLARASCLGLASLFVWAGLGAPAQAQVTIYLGGDGTSTPLRGREVCGTSSTNLNALDAINYAVSTASEGALKLLQLRAGIANPMGRDTSLATSPLFGVSLTNPTTTDVTVTEVRIQSTNRLFAAVLGVTPATGWTRPTNNQLLWQGSVTLPTSSAIEFICRGQPDSQSRPNEPLTITAITSAGNFASAAFTTTEDNSNTNPAVSLHFVEGGNPAYVSSSANFGQAQTGQSKTYTVRIQESEAGNTQAIPAGATLSIVVPPGFTAIAIGPSADFTVAPVTAPTGCAAGQIDATLLNPVLNRAADLSFVARAPSGLRSVALVPFDATLTSTTPAFITRTEHVVEILPTLPAGTRIGLTAETALAVTPQPMAKNHAVVLGAAYANPSTAARMVTQVRIRNPSGDLLFRDVFGMKPTTGWTRPSASEILWDGSVVVDPQTGIDFLARVQGNGLEQATPSPIEVTITASSGTYINTSGATMQRDGPGPSLYFLASDDTPAAYISDVPNGAPGRFRVAIAEDAGGTILPGSLLRVQVPARWSGLNVTSGQDGFDPATIVAPTVTNSGSIQVATNRPIRRERVVLTFEATPPTNVLQSLFVLTTSLIDAGTTLTSLTETLVETIELNDGGMVVRHLSPVIVDTVMRQIAVELNATGAPAKRYLLQIQNSRTATWESLASATLPSTTTLLGGTVRTGLSDYLDAALQTQVRVTSTGRDCHLLQEDFLRFRIDKYEVVGTSLAPITASIGFTLVPLEHLRLGVDEGVVDVNQLTLRAVGNDPIADLGNIHLIHDLDCDRVMQPSDPTLAVGNLTALADVSFGGVGPLFTASTGADACVIVAADILGSATVGNLVGLRAESGASFATSVTGPLPMPSRHGYPIASKLTLIIGTDLDRDGIADSEELSLCTSERDADSDDDGLNDGDEIRLGTDPCISDSDRDGLDDGLEEGVGAFPDLTDSDADGTPDIVDPAPADSTISGTNAGVFVPDLDPSTRTNPRDDDHDDDGLIDGDEDRNRNGMVENIIGGSASTGSGETDPGNIDSDGDGCQDGTETGVFIPASGTNTFIFKPDLNPATMTNPLDTDSDDDGLTDSTEDANCNGRIDTGESDPSKAEGPALLRNDEPALPLSRTNPAFSSIFVGTGSESLDALGPDLIADPGEGPDRTLNGSTDDDDTYEASVTNPFTDLDSSVLGDLNRPLVFYQLVGAATPLKLVKLGTILQVHW